MRRQSRRNSYKTNAKHARRGFPTRRSPEFRTRSKTLLSRIFEQLEERCVLSAIAWTNRGVNGGSDSDNFQATYGATNAPIARAIVDRAIQDWQKVIVNFNYQAFGGVNQPVAANTFTLNVSASNLGGGGRGVTSGVRADAQGRTYTASIGLDDNGGGAG